MDTVFYNKFSFSKKQKQTDGSGTKRESVENESESGFGYSGESAALTTNINKNYESLFNKKVVTITKRENGDEALRGMITTNRIERHKRNTEDENNESEEEEDEKMLNKRDVIISDDNDEEKRHIKDFEGLPETLGT
jgi:hypothetical protein